MPLTVPPPPTARRPKARAFYLRLLFIATFRAALGALFAAEPSSESDTTRAFNLPADEARSTLRLFAEQSGRGLVVDSETVHDVRTNAVHGNFTPRAALSRLLAGTPLVATQDPQSGAFAVRREPESPAKAPRQTQPGQSNTGSIEGRVQNIATGRYLENARVAVKNTDIVVFTDDTGTYRIARLPAGRAMIEVFFTGLDVERVPLIVAPGQTSTQDFGLTNVAVYGKKDPTVKLEAFQVAANRDKDSAMIAINEQRFAPNIKNVVSTDSQGEVISGDMGQFLKYLPGVDLGGGGVLIRGFPQNLTEITADGAPLANAGSANAASNRTFGLDKVSINNVSRVEVTKMPTPATPADSLSGSVNIISKSAFESDRWQVRYTLSMTASKAKLHFDKQPSLEEEYIHYVKPSGNFDLVLPLGKKFGLTLAGLHHTLSTPLSRTNITYTATAVGSGASFARPFLSSQTNPVTTQFPTRDSVSLRADWRVTRNAVLSAGYQFTKYDVSSMNYTNQQNPGTVATPSVAGGVPLSFGPDFTIGATGRGAIGQLSGINMLENSLGSGTMNYRFDNGEWKVDGMASASLSRSSTNSEKDGFFRNFYTTAKVPVRVSLLDFKSIGTDRVEAYTNDNRPFDMYDINNYNITTAASQLTDIASGVLAGAVDVKRRLRLLPFTAALQAGWRGKRNEYDRRSVQPNYTYNGINGDLSAAPYATKVYVNVKQDLIPGTTSGGKPSIREAFPYASSHYAWRAWEKNPALFSATPAQQVANERSRRNLSEFFREDVNAFYLQTEMRLLRNRLSLLAGVRFEQTEDIGQGPLSDPGAVWVRDPDGTFAHTPAGARIRRPEAGAAGSMDELNLTLKERGYRANRQYDGYYPSLHLTYGITENLLARAAYARTYGRPNFSEIIPNTTISENDLGENPPPGATLGTITVRNTGLRPWAANNYELALEYYTAGGGLFGASVFRKDIQDFFGTFARVATAADLVALGLDPAYAGWQVSTKINAGAARVTGMELSANHSLRPLGNWARNFRGFANFTKLELAGQQGADFSNFLPKNASWGLSFNTSRLSIMTKWNYRVDVKTVPAPSLGLDAYDYVKGGVTIDLITSYQFSKRVGVFFHVLNATDKRPVTQRYGSETPGYANTFQTSSNGGPTFYAGVKGSF